MLRISQLFLLIASLVLLTSCSSGSESPITSPTQINQAGNSLVGVSDRFPDGTPASGMGALGIFNLSVNADEISAELTPLRQNSLTDVLEVVDITNFLQMAPCSDCAKIGSISLDADGNLVVSIGIKHPFPAGDMLKPISGKNRGDLHVFNVEGTIISNTAGTSFPGLGSMTAGFTLVNADGCTPYLDSVLDDIYPTDATVHPYILHFDDYTAGNFDASNPMGFASVTDPPPSGNLVMAMGCDYDYQDYVFSIDGVFDFIYAVGCTYAVSSASKNERFTPEYRVPQHNKKAASEISVEIIANNLAEGDIASTADIEIHVVDISHGVAVGTNLDEMFADSSVGGITVEIPGVETGPVIVDISTPTGMGHDSSDPLVYAATITNTASGMEGAYLGLVKVLDTYSTGLNESPLLNNMDGIKRVGPIENPLVGLFDISEFATYAIFEIPIAIVNEDPVADLVPVGEVILQGNTIVWDATASYDPDGTIDLYEFDFDLPDGDPLLFSSDDDCTDGIMESLPYNDAGDFYAAVRVTDNLGGTDIAVVSFTVSDFIPTYWTQYMHNKNHDGHTNVTGPQTNHVEWTWDGPGSNALSLIEGYDGTIYYGTIQNGGRIHAINPDGTEKWTHQASVGASYCKPEGVTADDSILYISANVSSFSGWIIGLDTTTHAELWIYNDEVPCNSFSLVLDNDNLVLPIYSPRSTVCLDRNGNVVWNKSTSSNWCSAPAQGPDGTIYIESMPYVYGINPNNGATLYSYNYGSNNQTCVAVRPDGTVICNTQSSVRCCDAQLNLLWILSVPAMIIEGSGIGPNGEIYVTRSGALYAIAADGSQIDWTWTASSPSGWCSPAVGADGTIYIGSSGGADAINADGTTKWSLTTSGSGSGPIIAHDGSLYANISSVLHKISDP